MINKQRLIEEFMKYVQIASPSKKEKEFAEFITKELKELGFEVYIDNAGEKAGSNTGNVIGTLEGNTDKEPILFSCHLDTVTPGEEIKPSIQDGKVVSDGTTILGADDKAGIAAVLEALKVVKENNIDHGPIEVVFSICEEIGLVGTRNLDYKKLKSKRAFVLDSGGEPGEIIIQGPAQDNIDVTILGRSAHAGVSPEEGISAIQIAADAISNMKLLRIDEETTANIGIIKGGEATNIVASKVEISAEARSLHEDKLDKQSQHMLDCFEKAAEKHQGKVEINKYREYNAFLVEEDDEVVQMVKKACENVGVHPHTETTGGGSDTNIFNGNGIKAVNLATGERKPHTLEEYVVIEDLAKITEIVVEIIKIA